MPRARKISPPNDIGEAAIMLNFGLTFFWKKKKALCLFVLALAGSGGVLNVRFLYDYIGTERAEIREAKPRGAEPTGSTFSLMPQTFAGGIKKGVPIVWEGVVWGYSDTAYETHKLLSEPIILVKNKQTGVVVEVESEKLTDSELKQFKKGY